MNDDLISSSKPASEAAKTISEQAIKIIIAIAQGHSYEQILQGDPTLTYNDIFNAAQEALGALQDKNPAYSVKEIRKRHERAYEKWTKDEEDSLRQSIQNGETVARMAGKLKRKRGAIRSRILRLGLVGELSQKEQDRLIRSMENQDS